MSNYPEGADGPESPWNAPDQEIVEYKATVVIRLKAYGEEDAQALLSKRCYSDFPEAYDMDVESLEIDN